MYVYIESEHHLWTVGFYSPKGNWHSDSDHDNREEAAKRVAWLNGSRDMISLKHHTHQCLESQAQSSEPIYHSEDK